jgi:hypothetical protein
VPDDKVPAASWFGFRRCHSSKRSRSRVPGISFGMNEPDGRTTLPSVLRLHLPARMYSSTTSQSRMKCSFPHMLQDVDLRKLDDDDERLSEEFACLRASTIDFVNSVRIDPNCSALMVGGESTGCEGVGIYDVGEGDDF